MKENEGITLKEAIKLYYGEVTLSEEEEREVDEMLREIEESGFLEKCKEVARQKQKEREKKFVHIGRWCISKAACLIIAVLIVGLLGGTAYAAVRSHIREIEVNVNGDHSEVEVHYNDSTDETLSVIKDYYLPIWVPEGYWLEAEYRLNERHYKVTYVNEDDEDRINYNQYLPAVNIYYGAEEGIHENVSFGKYTGEYIDSQSTHYLIVTDGTYLYSIISKKIDKETMMKMIGN
ncbi:MAG: DUF4367 domain-containing protein [Lachnospiraceae bacterium]|nr:DUF4367 domain-containing protein [Lachnospiraceae bacterium]